MCFFKFSASFLEQTISEMGNCSNVFFSEGFKKENLEKAQSRILWWKGNIPNWEVDVKGRLGVQ